MKLATDGGTLELTLTSVHSGFLHLYCLCECLIIRQIIRHCCFLCTTSDSHTLNAASHDSDIFFPFALPLMSLLRNGSSSVSTYGSKRCKSHAELYKYNCWASHAFKWESIHLLPFVQVWVAGAAA